MTMIIPNDQDILCGKSRDCLQSPGSIKFRIFIDTYTDRYVNSTTKYAKMTITKEIYEKVSQKSRFLKFNEKENIWEEISVMAGRDKIGHALRFSARATRRKGKKAHKRSGSLSSSSSSDSGALGWESFAGQPQHQESSSGSISSSSSSSTALAEPPLPCLKLSKMKREATLTSDELDVFLQQVSGESKFDSLDFGSVKQIVEFGLSSMVENLELQQQTPVEPANEVSLSTLLSEPLGEWAGEDFAEGGFLFDAADFR